MELAVFPPSLPHHAHHLGEWHRKTVSLSLPLSLPILSVNFES